VAENHTAHGSKSKLRVDLPDICWQPAPAMRRFESIAEFCRISSINRQQFNRYLSGQNLPKPRSLKKICATLGASKASLFVDGPQALSSAALFSTAEQAIIGK
jgi:transcriptional regulator with XRE-family HTH domain